MRFKNKKTRKLASKKQADNKKQINFRQKISKNLFNYQRILPPIKTSKPKIVFIFMKNVLKTSAKSSKVCLRNYNPGK